MIGKEYNLTTIVMLVMSCAATCLPSGAFCQSNLQPPIKQIIDENGIDLSSMSMNAPEVDIEIGDSESGLKRNPVGTIFRSFNSESQSYTYEYQVDSHTASIVLGNGPGISGGPVFAYVGYNGATKVFRVGTWEKPRGGSATFPGRTFSSEPYDEIEGPGQLNCTNLFVSSQGACILDTGDGTEVTYDFAVGDHPSQSYGYYSIPVAKVTKIVKGTGEIIEVNYKGVFIKTVSSSLGWMLKYETDAYGITRISALNTSQIYCSMSDNYCQNSQNSPNISLIRNAGITVAQKNGQNIFSYETTMGKLSAVYAPSGLGRRLIYTEYISSASANIFRYDFHNRGSIFEYKFTSYMSLAGNPTKLAAEMAEPNGAVTKYMILDGYISEYKNPLNFTTKYVYDFSPGVIVRSGPRKIIWPQGDANGGYTTYAYSFGSSAGLPIESIEVPKAGSNLSPISKFIEYNCPHIACRIRPTKIIDARGGATDYTYSDVHGGVLTETGPVDGNGVRPQKRYEYTQLYPRVLNASGILVASPPVYRMTRMSSCRIATTANPAACVGTNDEIVTTLAYSTNNLQKTAETVAAGDGSASVTTRYGYDHNGRVIVVDGPREDVDDRSYRTYDPQGRLVFEISPDPDGPAGGLPRQVTKHHYDMDWREYLVETGRGTATDGGDFVPVRFRRSIYSSVTGLVVRVEEGQS